MAATASLTDFAAPEPEALSLSFGKHRGVPLAQVETSYLEWVKTADRITPDLLAAITTELASRAPKVKVQDRHRAPAGVPSDISTMARILIETGRDALSEALTDHQVAGAAALLLAYVDAMELESDPGTLPF